LAFSRALPLALIAAASCGPIAATTVIDDAEVALARAHAADGAKYALYETTLADLYLMKAKEEQGHARYTQAQELAADALKLAQAATRKAADGRSSGTATPAPQATIKHAPEPAPPPKPPAETSPQLPGEPSSPPSKTP
jgi:hypothetical protein